jgi:hypothetical protein
MMNSALHGLAAFGGEYGVHPIRLIAGESATVVCGCIPVPPLAFAIIECYNSASVGTPHLSALPQRRP